MPPQTIRKGYVTTEFWGWCFAGLVMLANGTNYINVPWDHFTIWVAGTGLYTGLRTLEKTLAHKTSGGTPNVSV